MALKRRFIGQLYLVTPTIIPAHFLANFALIEYGINSEAITDWYCQQ